MTRITGLRTFDLRFPTSQSLDGSDAMNPDPDYSRGLCDPRHRQAALEGHGLTFTIGRGNDICCAAIEAMRHLVVGLDLDWIKENPGRFWRHLTGDSQLRWIGPDKGAMHLATGAVVNAVWDLLGQGSRQAGLAAGRRDDARSSSSRSSTSATSPTRITPDEALAILPQRRGRARPSASPTLEREGYPCYTTSAGWLGYSDEKLRAALPGGRRRRLQPHQDEGRPRPRRRHPPARPSRAR